MIQIQLAQLLKRKGKTLYWLSVETGVRWDTLKKMSINQTERLELGVLDAICDVLKCEPGDVLVQMSKPRKARKANK